MPDLDKIVITMDLPRLGELIAAIATSLCEIRDLEPVDYDGEEMRELAVAGWRYVNFMHDRAEFARSVEKDISDLDAQSDESQPCVYGGEGPNGPEHKPEFGFFDPPV